jgi:hypothetical protein
MAARLFTLFFVSILVLAAAAKKTTATAKGENEDLILTVTLHLEPADVKALIGDDLGGHMIVCDVKVEPKYGKEVAIDRDDFLLRSYKEGEKAKPFAASQIAGSGGLVITETKGPAAASPGWSGMGGPMILGGGGGGIGVGGLGPTGVKAEAGKDGGENPLKKLLESRILPEKKISEPVAGLLYFALEKQKMKDLELTYGGRENRITLRFKP